MADADNSKDWPSLSDSNCTSSSGTTSKQVAKSKVRRKLKDSSTDSKNICDAEPDVTNGADGCPKVNTSTSCNNTGARKKQTGKTKWSPAPALLEYKDYRSERRHNDTQRFIGNGRRFNNHESSNYVANGHETSRGRSYRGGRSSRGRTQFRGHTQFRHESAVNSDSRRYLKKVPEEAVSFSHVDGVTCSLEELLTLATLQLEFYFSPANLVSDQFLRGNMDEQGYAQIELIATFPRMVILTGDLQRHNISAENFIAEAAKKSSHLEVTDDCKVRPVVNPLIWPLKELPSAAASIDTSEQNVDIMSSQLYHMTINQPTVWYPPYPTNGVYYPLNSNNIDVNTDSSDVPNGYASSSEQLSSPSSDLSGELASKNIPNDYQLENGAAFLPHEIPSHVSNNLNSVAEVSTIPDGHTDSDQVSSTQSDVNVEITAQYVQNDIQNKNDAVFYSFNGIRPFNSENTNTSAGDSNIPDGLEFPSDLRRMDEVNASFYGQIVNGVVMYNTNDGRYFAPLSNDILANSVDSSEDKSHNKSPEPSR